MNNHNIGYFQAVWLFLWNLIKSSGVYKVLRRVYDAISGAWKRSRITNWFRQEHFSEDSLQNSVAGRVLRSPFTFFAYLQRTIGDRLNDLIENSSVIGFCNTFLHNMLAFNLRFIGVLLLAFGAGGIVVSLLAGNELGMLYYIILAVGAVFSIFNVNLTEYLKGSIVIRFIEFCLGTEFSFDFFYKRKTAKGSRLIVAGLFGLIAGVVAGAVSPLYGILAVVAFAGIFLVLYKVEAGVYFAVFLTPLVPTMAVVGLSLVCLLSLIIKGLTDRQFKWKFDGLGFLVLAMLAVYLLSGVTSFAMLKSISIWGIYFAVMSFYFVVINTVKNKKQLFDILTVFAVSGTLVCLYGVAQYLFGWNVTQAWMDEDMFGDIKMRIYSTLDNPNVLGEYILLALPVAIGLMWTKKGKFTKFIYLCMSGVMMVAMILTFSRGCWIGLMVAAAVFITFVAGKLWGLGLIAIPFVPMLLPESITNRLSSIGDMKDSSTSYRVFIWMGTFAMIKDFWLSGIGMGAEAFGAVYPFYSYNAVVAPHSHNLFLQVLVESGAVGIVVFLAVLFVFYKKLIAGYQVAGGKGTPIATMMVALGAGVAGFLVQGMFDNCFYNYRVVMVFWTVLALGMACCYVAKSIAANQNGGQVKQK